jgi:hypothetical protein
VHDPPSPSSCDASASASAKRRMMVMALRPACLCLLLVFNIVGVRSIIVAFICCVLSYKHSGFECMLLYFQYGSRCVCTTVSH